MTTKLSIRLSFLVFVALLFGGLFWITDLALQHISFDGLSAADSAEIRRVVRLKENVPGYLGRIQPERSDVAARKQYRLETDEDGFIKPSKVHEKPALKVFFVGGSTTECRFVSEDSRWPFLVGRILEARTGKQVNSFNSGVSGNNSLHSLNIILNKILPYQPNYIVLMENANDLTTLAYEGTYWNSNIYRSPIIEVEALTAYPARIKRFLRTTFPGWFLAFRAAAHSVAPPDEFAAMRGSRIQVDPAELKRNFRRTLVAFVVLARAYEVEPILMTQFNRVENNDPAIRQRLEKDLLISAEEYVSLYRGFNEEIRAVARENNVKLIDLAREVPGTAEFLYDPFHLTEAGSRKVAEIVAEQFRALGI